MSVGILLRWATPVADNRDARPSEADGSEVRPAREPGAPATLSSVEELYLTGQHLEQYRHATRSPEPYWQEALSRDPGHSATHTALAALATAPVATPKPKPIYAPRSSG